MKTPNSDITFQNFVSELDSFVKILQQLWNAGHNAHLDLETSAGKAWVGLRLELGPAPGPHRHQFHPTMKEESPSWQRRRARGAAAKLTHSVKTSETEEISVEKVKEEIVFAEKAVKNTPVSSKIAEKAKSDDIKPVEETFIHATEKVKYSTDHVSYCKVCEDGSEETNSEEDLAWHLMNNHDPEEVLDKYGRQFIDDKRYCVRKGSPFYSWFSTPPIS